ncbi:uncharacterized protein LOC122853908 [Aphidius gifuensis]|uniref:uncharacterized protein LOC122853908 n=1 Tax=Aphidius gifuensis TaxID=684658 RepID=UPI001CDC0298|nr:uncharacterized protein LOC122853908 [Aphidius gifuensis]
MDSLTHSLAEITVHHDGEALQVPLDKNSTVSMISLKSFVPDTIGMTYNKPDGTSALVPLGNDKFYIPQGVKTCFIRVNKNNNFHNGIRNFKGIQLKTMLP